jgi:hypothetical protein
VLSAVLDNDGQQLSATQARSQALADADHLAVLYAIWTTETTPTRNQHYRDLLMNTLPPGHRAEPGHQARWLWRTLRGAELADLDPARVLAAAIAERDLAGSRDVPAVIDARIRHRLGSVVPLATGPWSTQVPAIADPDRRAYVTEIAALMDARKDRIGEHAAEHALPWAVGALGPVPGDPVDRLEWQQRAASIGAWRELSGYDDLWVPRTSSTSCDQAVFVDHAADARVSSDTVLLKIDRFGERFQRGSGVQRPVRPVLIVMGLVLAQDPPQMGLVPDEGAVEKLAPAPPDPAFGYRVHARRPDVAEHGPDPRISEDRVERSRIVRAAIADHELDPVRLLAEIHNQVPGLLGGPRPGGMQSDPEDADAPGGVLDHGQDVSLGAVQPVRG